MAPAVILLNGPRRSGKTTAARAMAKDRGVVIASIAETFKAKAIEDAGLDPAVYLELFELFKDVPFPELGYLTPRDLYIAKGNQLRAVNENAVADLWAANASALLALGLRKFVVPDVRFVCEFYAALTLFGPTNVLLMRIRRPDLGSEPWQGDIGSYFDVYAPFGHRDMTILNDVDCDYFCAETAHFGGMFLAQRSRA